MLLPYLKYFETLRLMSRVTLVSLIACMPWASLSSATSPPAQWAGMMHLAAMAIFAFLACVSFKTLWAQAGGVVFVFVFSGLMEVLHHFSPPRTGSWEDVAMNAMGCLAGVVMFSGIRWLGWLWGRASAAA